MGTGGGRRCRKIFNHWHHQLTERDAATAPTPADALHNVCNWKVIGCVCCTDHCQRKVWFITAENGTSSAGTRARPRFYWLCATSLTRMTIFFVFFSAITSWCWGHEHGGSKELRMVHGYPFIGAVSAESSSPLSRHWVSPPLIVSRCRPGLPLLMSLHMMFLRLLGYLFLGGKTLCV